MYQISEIFKIAAAYEMLLRLTEETSYLRTIAFESECKNFFDVISSQDQEKQDEKEKRKLPVALKKKLIGELLLNFDRDFAVITARIQEVDNAITRIVTSILFLMEHLKQLPEHVSDAIIRVITEGDKDLQNKLNLLYEKGSENFWMWLDVAVKIAEKRLKRAEQFLKKEI